MSETVRWKDKTDIGTLAEGDWIPVTDVSASNTDKKCTPAEIAEFVFSEGGTLDGTLNCGSEFVIGDNFDINGGSIDGVAIGSNDPCTNLKVDNIRINGNTISSTNTNGDINLTPNGSGEVIIDNLSVNDLYVDKITMDNNTISTTEGNIYLTPNGTSEVVIAASDLNYGGTAITATGSELNITDQSSDEAIFDAGSYIVMRANGENQITVKDGSIEPVTDDDIDLGASDKKFKDGYFDGTLYTDSIDCSNDVSTSSLDAASSVYVGGVLSLDGTPQSLSGAGEINSSTAVTTITTGGGDVTLKIDSGKYDGQMKILYMVTDGTGDATLDDAKFVGTSLKFDDEGEGAVLIWNDADDLWYCVGSNGATYTP